MGIWLSGSLKIRNNFMNKHNSYVLKYFVSCIIGLLFSFLSLYFYSVWKENYQQKALLRIHRNPAIAKTSIHEMNHTKLIAVCHIRSDKYESKSYREISFNNQIWLPYQEIQYLWQQLNLPKCSKDSKAGEKYELPVQQVQFEIFHNTAHLILLKGQKYSENQKIEQAYLGFGNLNDKKKAEIMFDEETSAIWYMIWKLMSLPIGAVIWGLIIWLVWVNFPKSKQS